MVETRDLVREYPIGRGVVRAVDGVTLQVPPGQLFAVRGRSGSGKTTLLSLIGALDRPTRERHVAGLTCPRCPRRTSWASGGGRSGSSSRRSGCCRSCRPRRTSRSRCASWSRSHESAIRVLELLDLVGLEDRARHRPHELSGGEQQRVAIARALANRPRLLLADEPTGQLDSQTGHDVMALIRSIVMSEGTTAIVATHDPALIELADRVIELRDGKVIAS